jgi:hypothetical protein
VVVDEWFGVYVSVEAPKLCSVGVLYFFVTWNNTAYFDSKGLFLVGEALFV